VRRKILSVSIITILVSFVFLFSSCAPTYQLTVSSLSGGTVTMDPSGGAYSEGTAVTLTAEPDSGFAFTRWENTASYSADSAISNSIQIVMPGDNIEISASFTEIGKGWTFMIYMGGDNTLSSFVSLDINEIEQGLYDSVQAGNDTVLNDVKVLILADRSGSADTTLYLAAPDNTSTVASTVITDSDDVYISGYEPNMADPDTLQHFISYSMTKYPSEYNALVIWDHGGGVKSIDVSDVPSREIIEDDGDYLYMNELQTALSGALGSGSLDIIGFDACIMGEVENAYEVRNQADYFVASMAEEWGYGWDYELIFDNFTTAGNFPTPAQMADILVTQFRDSTYSETVYYPNTMTAVKTSAMADLKTQIDSLAGLIHSDGLNAQTEFQSQRDASVFYYEPPRPIGDTFVDSEDDTYEQYILVNPYYDIYDFCTNIAASSVFSAEVKTQAQNVLDALAAAVVATYGSSTSVDSYYTATREPLGLDYYQTTDSSAVRGLSILIPNGEKTWSSVSHYAYDWWYATDITESPSTTGVYLGGLDFCTYDSDGTVETWRELFEAWYDSGTTTYTPGSY